MSGFPAMDLTKKLGIPREADLEGQEEFDYKELTGLGEIETLVLKGMNKILHAPSFRGKEQ